MNNAFEDLWREQILSLPSPQPLILSPVRNVEMEYLSCILCGHGHEESGRPPEWLVTHRTECATVTRGLHERCRQRNLPRIEHHSGASPGITGAEYFERWGQRADEGDLIQVNCTKHGAAGHAHCGLCADCGRPRHLPHHEACDL